MKRKSQEAQLFATCILLLPYFIFLEIWIYFSIFTFVFCYLCSEFLNFFPCHKYSFYPYQRDGENITIMAMMMLSVS